MRCNKLVAEDIACEQWYPCPGKAQWFGICKSHGNFWFWLTRKPKIYGPLLKLGILRY